MAQYLVAIYRPDDYDPSVETEATIAEIHALNREMIAAGARKLAAGLSGPSMARSLRRQPDGKVLATDGPYTETKEHIGGFWILEAADLDEAVEWGRKASVACRASVEVRPMLFPTRRQQLSGYKLSRRVGHLTTGPGARWTGSRWCCYRLMKFAVSATNRKSYGYR
jgi:hypothetical protein